MKKPLKNIEEHYSEAFDNQGHLDLEWNNPPEFVFEDAMASVNKINKSKKKRKSFFIILGTLLIIASSALIHTQQRISGLEKEVHGLKESALAQENNSAPIGAATQQPQSSSEMMVTMAVESIGDESIEKSQTSPEKFAKKATQPQAISKTNANDIALSPERNRIENPEKTATEALTAITSSANDVKPVTTEIAGTDPAISENTIDEILPISVTKLNVHSSEISALALAERNFDVPQFQKSQIKSAERGLVISLAARQNFSSLAMKGELNNSDQSLSDYDRNYSAYGIRLSAAQQLHNKLSLIGSLGYDKYYNKSKAVSSLSYSKSNEVPMTNGLASYNMGTEVEAPLGTMLDEMAMIVDPNMMENGEIISHESEIEQTLVLYSLNVGLGYELLKRNRFRLSTNFSTGLNYNSTVKTTMSSEYLMHDKIMDDSYAYCEETPGTKKWLGTIALGLQASLNLKRGYSLNLGTGHTRSMTSVSTADNPQFFLSNWHNSLGISKTF